MFEQFAYRHIPPLLLSAAITFGGLRPFTHNPEAAYLEYGLTPEIAKSPAAWPMIKIMGSRVSTIGLALLGMYARGHLEAMDILFAAMGWMAVVDGIVCAKDGTKGSVRFRVLSTGAVALWGLLGMTSGKYL